MKKPKIVIIALIASMMALASCGGNSGDTNSSTSKDTTSETSIDVTTSEDTSVTSETTSNDEPVETYYNIVIANNPDVTVTVTNLSELKAKYDAPVIFEVSTSNSEVVIGEVKVSYQLNGVETNVTTTHQGNTYGFYMPEGDVTISVSSSIKEYSINIASNSDVQVALDQTSAKANDTVSFAVSLLANNKDITSVKVTAGENEITTSYANDKYSFVMPKSDVTITVETVKNTYVINTNNDTNVYFNLIGAKEEYKAGDEVMFSASAKYGYELLSLSIKTLAGADVSYTKGESTYTFVMPSSDVTVSFEVEKLYTITTSSDDYSTITVNDSKDYYKSGSTVTFNVDVTDKNYELDEITIKNGSSVVNYTVNEGEYSFVMPSGNVVISSTTKKTSTPDVKDPFESKTTFSGTWNYDDGYTLYYMELTVVFNGDKTLSWKLTYDYDDDDYGWDDWSFKPMGKVASNVTEKASQNNVAYTYDADADEIKTSVRVKMSDKEMTIKLVRNGDAISSIYFTENMSTDFYQCGNVKLNKK